MTTTNHTSPSGEDAANGAIGEREAFEAWWMSDVPEEHRVFAKKLLDGYGPGYTAAAGVADAWEAWQARASLPAGKVAQAEPVAWQVRRVDGRIDGVPIQWENCTKDLFDATLQTGRYAGYENGPRCEVRALCDAQSALNAKSEPVPVEVWRGERKVTIYPDCVLHVWGANIESEMSDAPRNLQTVQDAMDWLYAAPPAQTQVALTDERINKAIVTWFDDRGFEHDFERRMRNALLAALPEIDSGRAAIAQAEVKP